MSNQAILTSTKFEAIDGSVSYGYTLSDDYALDFDSTAEAMIEDDLDLLRFTIKNAGSGGQGILDSIQENEKGLSINGSYYEWEQIANIFEEV